MQIILDFVLQLGTLIRNELDPLFTEQSKYQKKIETDKINVEGNEPSNRKAVEDDTCVFEIFIYVHMTELPK